MALGGLNNEGDLERWISGRIRGWVAPLLRGIAKLAGIDFGKATAVFSAATAVTLDIPHGLGVVPSSVSIPGLSVSGTDDFRTHVETNGFPTTTTIRVRVLAASGAAVTTNVAVYWMAVV